MSKKQLKNPQNPEQAERTYPTVVQKFHGGMLKGGSPLSTIDLEHVYRHVNTIGFGRWAAGRPGTRSYSRALLPEELCTAEITTNILNTPNRFSTGDRVKLRSDGTLPDPLIENTVYYIIYHSSTEVLLAETYDLAVDGTAIDLTDIGTGTHYIRYAGIINASLDHRKHKRIVKLYGKRVYASEKILDQYNEVLNLETTDPIDQRCTIVESGDAAVLASGDIFRVVLDDSFYYMYKLSCPVPTILLTDINESVTLLYGYHYVFSFGRISGSGYRNRLTENCQLVLESGTCKNPAEEKYYSEVFFDYPIGVDLSHDHILSIFTLPIALQSITHFTLYRTKNIGVSTGGTGNNSVFFIWDDDIPVAKAFQIVVNGDVATIINSIDKYSINDVGCTLRVNAAGTRTAVIESFVSENVVNLVTGHSLNVGVENVAIGEGRVMVISQSNYLITRESGDAFVIEDEGRTLFLQGGVEIIINRFIDADHVETPTKDTISSHVCTIQLNTGTFAFRRKFNDSIMDDCVGIGEIGLTERILSQRDIYIPQVNFDPIPASNIVVSDSGFSIFSQRDGNDYWYSNIGYKPYIEGQYRADHQFAKLRVSIRDIRIMPATAIILCNGKTYTISLNVTIPNIGNADVGEYVQKLTEASEADGEIGVIYFRTIAFINASLLIAVTTEPAVRKFDGHAWSQVNYAISSNGLPAVMEDLNKLDPNFELIGWYSHMGGYKISAKKWEEI
jgi:hypothetical protein